MVAFIFYAVIIGVILCSVARKQNKQVNRGTQMNNCSQNFAQPPRQQNNMSRNYGQNANQQYMMQQQARAQQYRQQQTKQRLQQKYPNQPVQNDRPANYNGYTNNAAQNKPSDILSRAKANVEEEAHDVLRCISEVEGNVKNGVDVQEHIVAHEQYHMGDLNTADYGTNSLLYNGGMPSFAMSETMKQVNDLMITGYDGAMSFERDFIAEGVEMLNSFNA